jgi:hypothetical protein
MASLIAVEETPSLMVGLAALLVVYAALSARLMTFGSASNSGLMT